MISALAHELDRAREEGTLEVVRLCRRRHPPVRATVLPQMSDADVLAIHHRHGIPVNPLYRKGFSRVGCNPCIYATKEEIALTAEHFPQRIDQIRALEVECENIRIARNEETPDRYKHAAATFFRAKMADSYTRERQWVPTPANGRPKGRLSHRQDAPPRRREGPGDVARREGAQLQAHAHRRHRVVVAHVARRAPTQGDPRGARGRVLSVGHVRGADEGHGSVSARPDDLAACGCTDRRPSRVSRCTCGATRRTGHALACARSWGAREEVA